MNTIKDALSDRDILLLLTLASKVCGEKYPPTNPLIIKQIEKLREETAKILIKVDEKTPGIIVEPSDGKAWNKRAGPKK